MISDFKFITPVKAESAKENSAVKIDSAQTPKALTELSHSTAPTGIAAGVEALGIDGRLLTAQIVNFVILLLLLRKFLYGPLLELMEKRRQSIADSLQKKVEIDKEYDQFILDHEQRINDSKNEAAEIINQAKLAAEGLKQEIIQTATVESEKMIAKAAVKIEQEKAELLSELKQEIGTLVVLASAKVIGQSVANQLDERSIQEAVEGIKQ